MLSFLIQMGLGGLQPNDGIGDQITLVPSGAADLVFPSNTVKVSFSIEGAGEALRYLVDSNAAAPAQYGGYLEPGATQTLEFSSPQPQYFGTAPDLFLHLLNASPTLPTRVLVFWQTLVLP